jgi:hypothetical protein
LIAAAACRGHQLERSADDVGLGIGRSLCESATGSDESGEPGKPARHFLRKIRQAQPSYYES